MVPGTPVGFLGWDITGYQSESAEILGGTDNGRQDTPPSRPLSCSISCSVHGGYLNTKVAVFSIRRSHLRGSGGVTEAEVHQG